MSRIHPRSGLSILIRVLTIGTVGLVLLVAGIVGAVWMAFSPTDTVGQVDFDTELVLEPGEHPSLHGTH